MGIFHIAVTKPDQDPTRYEWEIYVSRTASITDMRYNLRQTKYGQTRFDANTIVEVDEYPFFDKIPVGFMKCKMADVLNLMDFSRYYPVGNDSQRWVSTVLTFCVERKLLNRANAIWAIEEATAKWSMLFPFEIGMLQGTITDEGETEVEEIKVEERESYPVSNMRSTNA